jgi:APA family basic amino acid/polyamine antiporter
LSAAPQQLERRLGPLDAAAIIVANVIGGGILFTPPQVASAVPSAIWFLGAWVAGGALAFAGAMAYAELAALRPRSGGEYVYLNAAFGRLAAFLTGWTSFVAGFTGAIAASAIVLTFYLDRFIPGAANSAPFFVVPLPYVPLTFSRQTLVALSAVALMSWIHVRGVGPGRITGDVLAALKVSALLMFIALGVTIGTGSAANLTSSAGSVASSSWLLALIPVMFTYSGWNAAGYIAEEIRNPGTNVPKAFALGTAAVIFIYLALNMLYLYVLPVGELAQVKGSVLDVVADRLLGARAGNIMGIVSIISLLASISAMTFAGPRVYYAMARDGLFFGAAGRVHPRYKTPASAIVAQAVWAGLLVVSGSADALTNYTGFVVVLFSGLAVLAVFVLRHREPSAPRPYSSIGYPVGPALFAIAALLIVVNALYTAPPNIFWPKPGLNPTGGGVLVIALGIPLYLWLTRRARVS